MELLSHALTLTVVRYLLTGFVGAGVGYGFYRLVGCRAGMCFITNSPWLSALWGAVIAMSMGPLW